MRPSGILLPITLAFAFTLLLAPLAAEVKVPRVGLPRFSHPDSPQTQCAVGAFQARDRLTVSGLLDCTTREALKVGADPKRGLVIVGGLWGCKVWQRLTARPLPHEMKSL